MKTPVGRLLRPLRGLFAPLATALLLVGPSLASAQSDDLPARVGRLADLGGSVYISTEERPEDWVEALRNATLTSGDNLWVSGDGRAEIDYGGGQFRLAGNTNLHVARLDDRVLALFLAHGRVIVRVRALEAGEAARIDTPNTQLALTRPGLYRIEVTEDRERTELVVREGEATMSVASGAQQVLPGQTASVEGQDPNYADVRSGFGVDGFDSWSADRDRRYERSRSANYVSRQMVGYADLDEYGRWDSTPDYGAIWYPTTVASGWAPYRYGRWSWVAGYGWTWVDDAPWGYAPFHYGRWIYVGNRWGWAPGGYVLRPAWAPALVGWYGGSGWTASVSFGAPVYGWVPLGWGEPYIPAWRNCSDRCWTRYNRPYVANYAERRNALPTRYVNWSAPGGATAVSGAIFTGRQPVQSNVVPVRPQVVSNAPVLGQAPVLARPTVETIPGARPTVAAPPPAVRFQTRPVQIAPATPASVPPRPSASAPGMNTSPATSPANRQGTAPSYAPRTSGAPPVRPEARAPQATMPSRVDSQPPAPQQAAPATRNVPSGTYAAPPTYAPQPSAAPRSAPPPSNAPQAVPRSAPPPSNTPQAMQRSAPPPSTAPQSVQRSAPPPSSAPQAVQRSTPPVTSNPPVQRPPQQAYSTPPTRSAPPAAPQSSAPVARPAPSPQAAPPAPPPPQNTRSAPPPSKPASKDDPEKPSSPR